MAAKLEPDEEQYLKLAHLAGVPMSSATMKAIKSLCEIGCDPNQIVASIELIAQNKIKSINKIFHPQLLFFELMRDFFLVS